MEFLEVIRKAYGLSGLQEIEAAEVALNDGMIIPVFDGFDEIDETHRGIAAGCNTYPGR